MQKMPTVQFPFSDLQRKEFVATSKNIFLIKNPEERYTYKTDPKVTFHLAKAKIMTEITIRKLKRQKILKYFKDKIQELSKK